MNLQISIKVSFQVGKNPFKRFLNTQAVFHWSKYLALSGTIYTCFVGKDLT